MRYLLGTFSVLLIQSSVFAMEAPPEPTLEEIGIEVLAKLSQQRSTCYSLSKKIETGKRVIAFKIPYPIKDKNKRVKKDDQDNNIVCKRPRQLLNKPLCINELYMVFRSANKNKVYLVDIATGDFLHRFDESRERIEAASFIAENEITVTFSSGKQQLWTVESKAVREGE